MGVWKSRGKKRRVLAILAVVGLGIIGGITAAVIVSTSRSREE